MKKHKLTEKEFAKIKELLKMDFSQTQIGKILGRASSIISTVNKFDTLEAYHQSNRERMKKYQPKEDHKLLPKFITVSDNQPSLVLELKQIKSILLRIDTTLRLATDGDRKLRWA